MEKRRKKKIQKKKKVQKKKAAVMRRKTKQLLSGMIEEVSQDLLKFWTRRWDLFSLFDDGIKCDEQGLFSVTPEKIARHQAETCGSGGVVIDGFSGVGGNAIQFATRGNHVVAIEIDPIRIKCAQHNARVYGVDCNIDFVIGDFFQLAPLLKIHPIQFGSLSGTKRCAIPPKDCGCRTACTACMAFKSSTCIQG